MHITATFIDLIERICLPAFTGLSETEMRNIIAHGNDPEVFGGYQLRCFAGWKSAQMQISEMQLAFLRDFDNLRSNAFSEYAFRNLQRLLDVIIWHHFGNMSDMKMIFHELPVIAPLKDHNIETHLAVAERQNLNPDEFWLITDLTSGVRVGDFLICKKGSPPAFAELKSGQIGHAIGKMLFAEDPTDLLSLTRESNAARIKAQIDRTIRQIERGSNVSRALRNEEHIDDRYPRNKRHTILTESPDKEVANVIAQMLEEFHDGDLACVEDCLYICTLNNFGQSIAPAERFSSLLKGRFSETDLLGPKVDLMLYLNGTSFTRPVYLQPFSRAAIHDLLSRARSVHLFLSLPRFARKFSNESHTVELVAGNELKKLYPKHKAYSSRCGGYIVKITDLKTGSVGLLSNGLLQKMFSELFAPSALLKNNLMVNAFVDKK